MRLKVAEGENEILELLKVMSRIAKSAKKIEEITDVMDNISFQATMLTLDATVLSAESGKNWDGLSRMKGSVRDSAEEMYSQFNLLLDEVCELNKYVNENNLVSLKSKDFN